MEPTNATDQGLIFFLFFFPIKEFVDIHGHIPGREKLFSVVYGSSQGTGPIGAYSGQSTPQPQKHGI